MPLNPSGCELKEWPARFLSVTRLLTFLVCLVAVSEVWGSDSRSADLTELSAKEAVSLLCSQQVTAVTYAKALLARGKEIDCLNSCAFTSESTVIAAAEAVDAKAAAGEDVRPLCGLAFAVKDNIDVEGYPTAAGTPTLEEYVLDRSSPLIKRLEEANGVVLAKTRMHELAEGVTSISPYYGAVLNPYKVDTHVGGSSGGTAALVAARGVTAGFCSDTGGSCRIPASLTGVVGFRPTSSGKNRQQCYNTGGGIVPISTTRDTAGLIARNVEDIQFLDTLFNDCPRVEKDVALKGLRVGLPLNWWLDIGAETQDAFTAALGNMTAAGVEFVEFDVALMLAEQRLNAPDYFSYIYEMPRELGRYITQHRYNVSLLELINRIASPLVKQSLEEWSFRDLESWPTPRDYAYILGTVTPKITQLWNDYFDNLGFDVIVVPTTPITARPIDAAEPYSEINGRLEPTLHVYSRTAEVDCPSAVPGLSIPIGLASDGLPIGLQLHSRPGDDGTLLAVGKALEGIFAKSSPPKVPSCQGCRGKVKLREPRPFNPKDLQAHKDAHRAAQELSIYAFEMDGQCLYTRQGTRAGVSDKTEL